MLEHFPVRPADYDGPVLVTGAGGCIGSWALALLVRAGVPAVAFDLKEDTRRPKLLMTDAELAKVRWLTGDIADTKRVREVADDPLRAYRDYGRIDLEGGMRDTLAAFRALVARGQLDPAAIA